MEDIRSWWEVPSIAHFCSLFRTAFGLTDFEIEDLEEALLSHGTVDGGSSLSSTFLADLHARLLKGLFETNDIDADNFEPFLSQVLKIRWEDELNKENPLKENSYSSLPVQQKVEILHNLCDFRLDVADVQDLLKGLDADSLRVEPLGKDSNSNIYWYFYGTRLYRETPVVTAEEKEKKKSKKKKKLAAKKKKLRKKKGKGKRKQKKKNSSDSESDFVTSSSSEDISSEEEEDFDSDQEDENSDTPKWCLVCSTAAEWEQLAESFKKSKHRDEKLLYQTLSEDFVPEIEKMIDAKEKAYQKKLLELAPRRASTRIAIKMSLKDDTETKEFEEDEDNLNERDRREEEKRLQEEEKQKERDKQAEKRQQERAERARLREERQWMRMNGEMSEESQSLPEFDTDSPKPEKKQKKAVTDFDEDDDRDEDLYTGMYKILDYLKKHNNAWPFLEPVDESYAPQYHEIIEHPMDLSTIEEKLDKGSYKKLDEFSEDMQLMFDNCDEYNGPDSMYTKMANTLKAAFERQVKKHFPDDEDNSDEDYEEELRKGRRKEREREMKGKQKGVFSVNDFMMNRQENQPPTQGMGPGGMPFPFMNEMGMNRGPNPMMAARPPQDFQFPPGGVPPGFGPDGRPVYPPQFYQNYYNAAMARFNMQQQRQFNPYQFQPPPLTRAPMGDPQGMRFPQQGMEARMPFQRPPNGMTPPGLSRMQAPPRMGLPPGATPGQGGMPQMTPGSQGMSENSPQQQQQQPPSNQSEPSPTSQPGPTGQPQQGTFPEQFRPSGAVMPQRPGFPLQMQGNHPGAVPGQFPGYPNMNGPPRLQRAPMDQMAQHRMGMYGGSMPPGFGMRPGNQLPPGFMPSSQGPPGSQGPPKSQAAPITSAPSSTPRTGGSGSALTSPAPSDASGDEKKSSDKEGGTPSPAPRTTPVSTSGEPTPSSLTAEKEKRESEQAVPMSRPQSFGQPFPQQPYYGRPIAPYPQGMTQGMRLMPQERKTTILAGPGASSPAPAEQGSKPTEQLQNEQANKAPPSQPSQIKQEMPTGQKSPLPQGAPTPPTAVPREQTEQPKTKGLGLSISHILGSPSRDTTSPRSSENRAPVITTLRRSPPPLVSDIRRQSDKTKSDSNRSSPLVEGNNQAPPERPPPGYKSWPQDQGPPRQGSPSLSGAHPKGFLEELFNGKPPSKDVNMPEDQIGVQGAQRLPFTSLLKEIAPQRESPGKEGSPMGGESTGAEPHALGSMNQAHKEFMTRNYLQGRGDPQRYGIPKQMGPYGMFPGKMGPEGMTPLGYRAQGPDMASLERERAMQQLAGKRTAEGQFVDLDAMQYREQPGYPTREQLFLMEQRRQQERMGSSRSSVIGGEGMMHMMRFPDNMMLRQQQEQQFLQAMYSNRMRNGNYTSGTSGSDEPPSSKVPRFS